MQYSKFFRDEISLEIPGEILGGTFKTNREQTEMNCRTFSGHFVERTIEKFMKISSEEYEIECQNEIVEKSLKEYSKEYMEKFLEEFSNFYSIFQRNT